MSNDVAYRPWIEALEADHSSTFLGRGLKYPVIVCLLIYCVYVLVAPATQTKDPYTEQILYVSPEGVRMQLNAPLAKWRLLAHSGAGVVMILACIFQKLSAPMMLKNMRELGRKCAGGSQQQQQQQQAAVSIFRRLHTGAIGPCTLGCMGMMAVAGFAMRTWSTLQNFNNMMILFVAPWPILGGVLYFSAKFASRKTPSSFLFAKIHVICGNSMLWACIAVVVARLWGACLQRMTTEMWDAICVLGEDKSNIQEMAAAFACWLTPQAALDLGDSKGYYAGIGAATVFFALLILLEVWMFLRGCSQIHEAIEKANKRD